MAERNQKILICFLTEKDLSKTAAVAQAEMS